jgi:hypothetical protein
MPAANSSPDPSCIVPYAGADTSAARPYRDLCSTCNHKKACGDRSTPERPILFCEQFDAFVSASTAEVVRAVPALPKKPLAAGRRNGLCANCENAESCTAPTAEGGIWHCEEYR